MSKYSQLPRNTIELLTMRASRGLDVKDYANWAVGALVDGFDSRSLAILASLDYDLVAQTEAPEYFLKAVKELKLPIPDCELAVGNWYGTDSLYRKLGLSLPDEMTLLGQHLAELAEQIKEGVIDPIIGLDRIYHEIVWVDRYGLQKTDGSGERGRSDFKGRNGTGIWEWDVLRSYIKDYDDDYFYDANTGYHFVKREPEPNLVKQEIITFATDWLANPETRFSPKFAIHKPLSEEEKKKILQIKQAQQMQQQIQAPVHIVAVPSAVIQPESIKIKERPTQTKTISDTASVPLGMTLLNLVIKWIVLLVLLPPLVSFLSKLDDISMIVVIAIVLLGFLAIAAIFNYIDNVTGISKKSK